MKNKFLRVMERRNKQTLHQKETKYIKQYQDELKNHGLFWQVKDDYDYIKFEITLTSYLNMKSLQKNYFEVKESLRDLWNHLNYQEKKFLLYKELDLMNQDIKTFFYQDKEYYIAYFDDLLNAYYDHEILIFETSNYRHLLSDFKELVIDTDRYGLAPIEAHFCEVRIIYESKDAYVLYADRIKRFYASDGFSFAMHRRLSEANIQKIAKLMVEEDLNALMTYLIDYDLVNKRVKHVLGRMVK